SGAARATRPTPIVPDAPATFSITTDWPSGPRIPSATMRARMSVVPPGPYGATIVTARDGHVCADADNTADSADANRRTKSARFMLVLAAMRRRTGPTSRAYFQRIRQAPRTTHR